MMKLLRKILAILFRIEKKLDEPTGTENLPVEETPGLPPDVEPGEPPGPPAVPEFEPPPAPVPSSPNRPSFGVRSVGRVVMLAFGVRPGRMLVYGSVTRKDIDGRYIAKVKASAWFRIGNAARGWSSVVGKKLPSAAWLAFVYKPDGAKAWSDVVWLKGFDPGDRVRFCVDKAVRKPSIGIVSASKAGAKVDVHGGGKLVGYISFFPKPDSAILTGAKPRPYPKASGQVDVMRGDHAFLRWSLAKVDGTTPMYLHVALLQSGQIVAQASRKIG